MNKAFLASQLELRGVEQNYRALGWDQVLSASGTIRAIDEILRASGLAEDAITAEGLAILRERTVAGHVENSGCPA